MKQYIAKWQDGNFCLCKSKIEVGASAKWSSLADDWKAITEINLEEAYILLEGDDQKLYIEDCIFKDHELVGAISHDAYGYVQDGQRFDESNVVFIDNPGEDMDTEYIPLENFESYYKSRGYKKPFPKYLYNLIIAIKGPCGHFH